VDYYAVLIPELQDDPLSRGYAGMTDAEALAVRRDANRTRVFEARITELGIIKSITEATGDPANGEGFMQALEAVGAGMPLIKRMLKWLQPGAPGLDMGDPHVRGTLDLLASTPGTGITTAAVAAVKATAEAACSRAEELGIPDVGRGHIKSARELIAGGA